MSCNDVNDKAVRIEFLVPSGFPRWAKKTLRAVARVGGGREVERVAGGRRGWRLRNRSERGQVRFLGMTCPTWGGVTDRISIQIVIRCGFPKIFPN